MSDQKNRGLWRISFEKADELRPKQRRTPPHDPPTGWDALSCLDERRDRINGCLANALCDPGASFVRVPVDLLASVSALAADVSNHLWSHDVPAMDEPLKRREDDL